MQVLRKNLPNAITLCNLIAGCLGILQANTGSLTLAATFMGVGMIADFLDGLVARLLNSKSAIGGDLDSLSDMVTFGVLPGFIAFSMLSEHAETTSWLPYLALIIPVFSAIRLAIFNNDDSQTLSFNGIPTPLNALMIGSWPYIAIDYPELFTPFTLATSLIILALLLVAPIRLMALKFTSFAIRPNLLKYLFLLLSGASLLLLHFLAVPIIFGLYILISIAYKHPDEIQS